ncbi:TrkA C-terminal domain-containing protein [Thiocapsa rosea]|uniref:TrkA C-terminal domain-containing protein n=1 Tax=Thiocapsa rosea TaxID=69360 RepID=UPI000EB5B4AE|nr:TrkA C-terminal domain-containing protein [Thiocapsa rosea]
MMFARRWLGRDRAEGQRTGGRPSLTDWVETYRLAERELRVRVREGSPLVGQPLGALALPGHTELAVLAVERSRPLRTCLIGPDPTTEIAAGDILLIDSATLIAPPNAMVATAGNYRFVDYLRVGLPFVVIVMAVSVALVRWLFPF